MYGGTYVRMYVRTYVRVKLYEVRISCYTSDLRCLLNAPATYHPQLALCTRPSARMATSRLGPASPCPHAGNNPILRLCKRLYIYISYTYIHMHIYLHIHIHVHIHVHIQIHIHVHTHTHCCTHTHTYTYTYKYMYVLYTHICISLSLSGSLSLSLSLSLFLSLCLHGKLSRSTQMAVCIRWGTLFAGAWGL